MKLSEEQIAYLKGLDSKKKQRKFLLDILLESVIGESEKIYGNLDFLKDADSPRYMFPHEMEEIQRLNPSFTNTTAPRTFESAQEQSRNFKIGEVVDFVVSEAKKEISNSEFLKSDMVKDVTLEEIIKSKLIIRGFKSDKLTNNRGLISATIDETVNEVKKCYESAKSNPEAKYTELDMVTSFYMGRQKQPRIVTETQDGITYQTDKSFDDWFEKFKKGKEND